MPKFQCFVRFHVAIHESRMCVLLHKPYMWLSFASADCLFWNLYSHMLGFLYTIREFIVWLELVLTGMYHFSCWNGYKLKNLTDTFFQTHSSYWSCKPIIFFMVMLISNEVVIFFYWITGYIYLYSILYCYFIFLYFLKAVDLWSCGYYFRVIDLVESLDLGTETKSSAGTNQITRVMRSAQMHEL